MYLLKLNETEATQLRNFMIKYYEKDKDKPQAVADLILRLEE